MQNELWLDEIKSFEHYLREEEKSEHTIEKYIRDVRRFINYIDTGYITKDLVIAYKQDLINSNCYKVGSINSMLASVNAFLRYLGYTDCTVKSLKTQRKIYCEEEKELTKLEYESLLKAAKGNPRLELIIKTICSTGIRVS